MSDLIPFPTGIKRYAVGDLSNNMRAVFHEDYYKGNELLAQFRVGADSSSNTFKSADIAITAKIVNSQLAPSYIVSAFNNCLVPVGEGVPGYPIFECTSIHLFDTIYEHVSVTTHHTKKHYQSPARIVIPGLPKAKKEDTTIPVFAGMRFYFDPKTNELVIVNMPYEGELIRNREYTAIHQAIQDEMLLANNKIKAMSLIMSDGLIKPNSSNWQQSKTACVELPAIVHKIMDNTAELEDYIQASATLKLSTSRWSIEASSQVLEIFDDAKPKWQSGTRMNVMYQYGGYDLPPNYADWFDKS